MITEPAPSVAYPARHIAPTFSWDEADELAIPILGLFGGGIVLMLGGNGVGAVAGVLFGEKVSTPAWVAFDLLLLACIACAYVLVARYGLRFQGDDDDETQVLRVAVEQGNTAWKCLPAQVQEENAELLRAMNAAARLVLIDPTDSEAHAVLEKNAKALHELTLTALPSPTTV
ncbi:hypothetical protein [Streptomyces sp. NPDC057966]|uniref:hypothetical protein n=1 Tax=Streptomyces sp. NPDC057966 TaxID=3346292 RepID=UPI0036ED605F